MSSRSRTALCAFLVLVLVAGPVAGQQADSAVASGDALRSAQSATGMASVTSDPAQEIHITVRANGDARWAVAVEFTLDNRSDTAAFEELAERFEAGDSQYLSVDIFSAAAEQASAATGRSMELRDLARTHDVANGTGRLVLSFTWTNFATVREQSLAVGDAFETTDGQWLGYLNDNQTLYIEPPEGYGIRSRSGTPPVGVDDGAARWEGPVSFSPEGIRIVYAGNVATTTTPTPTNTSPTTTTTPGPDSGGLPLLPAVVVALVAVLAAAFVFRRRPGDTDGAAAADTGTDDDPDAGGAASTTDDSDATPETAGTLSPSDSESALDPTDGAESPTGSTATATGTTGAEAASEAQTGGDDGIDEALLSDEERVERLLERNGGRMKQANIVKETGWSNAKVSQLLSAMDEDDRIDKLRIGRENLISFPDEDVTDFESE